MTFDQWCDERKIKFFKEALYHSIMARLDGEERDDPAEWQRIWDELLKEVSKKALTE